MILIITILFVVIILILLLFLIMSRIKLVLNTEKAEMNMTLLWLSPLLKAIVVMEDARPVLRVYLLNKVVYKKVIRKGKKSEKRMELVQLAEPKDVHVDVRYGFSDPFSTGIACGVIQIASQFINIDSVDQTPDFLAASDYIYLNATAKVNLGSTLLRFFKSKGDR